MVRRLLSLLVIAVAVLSASPAHADTTNPLEPLDTSSPQATMRSFQEQEQAIADAARAYSAERNQENLRALYDTILRSATLLDLSEVPESSKKEVTGLTQADLSDILDRIPQLKLDQIPDDAEVDHWTIPGTQIAVTRIDGGVRDGQYVFSADSVAKIPGYREQVDGLPILNPDPLSRNWQQAERQLTGPWLPAAMVRNLPHPLQRMVLGTPLWKGLLAVLCIVLVSLLVALWQWFVTRGSERGTVTGYLARLTTPIILAVLVRTVMRFLVVQVNLSGYVAQGITFLGTLMLFVAAAWAFWIFVRLIVEWIIATPGISDDSYDAHLLRLGARIVSIVGSTLIVLWGADRVGIPALGLLAGLGIGGLAAALAAQNTLENLFGGFTLFADKPFSVGDAITFGSQQGTVETIGPRSTRIRTLSGTLLSVPNTDLVKASISNLSQRENYAFRHDIGVSPETTTEQLRQLVDQLVMVLREHPAVEISEGMPRATVVGLTNYAITIAMRADVNADDDAAFAEIQQELLLACIQAGEALDIKLAPPPPVPAPTPAPASR